MKTIKNLLIISILLLSYYGCFSDDNTDKNLLPDQSSYSSAAFSEVEGNLPTEIYYSFKRDRRKCMFPMCGGYWLKAVNVDETVCADGTIGGEQGCYVAAMDLNGIEFRGKDLVVGIFRKQAYGQRIADHLVVDAAFSPALNMDTPYSWISLIQDTGIRCITTPCPSQKIAIVNTDYEWTKYGFSFGVKGKLKRILEEAFKKAYANGGVLVQSSWKLIGWWKWELSVTNVYLKNEPVKSGPFCTFMKQEGENAYIAWNVETYEQGKSLLAGANFESGTENIVDGTCGDYAKFCTKEYRPICGTIDATGVTRTYGNLCELKVAVRMAAGKDSKATGTWTEGVCPKKDGAIGDPCGGMLGLQCQEGLFCKYNLADRCGAADMAGRCSELAEMCPEVSMPVCGCDGRDYDNECKAWQHGISAAHEGMCN